MKKDKAYCYWETTRMPKKFIETLNLSESPRVSYEQKAYELIKEFAIYFAVKGKVMGYFIVHDVTDGAYDDGLHFHSETWHEIKDGETLKPSQGWRYYPTTQRVEDEG